MENFIIDTQWLREKVLIGKNIRNPSLWERPWYTTFTLSGFTFFSENMIWKSTALDRIDSEAKYENISLHFHMNVPWLAFRRRAMCTHSLMLNRTHRLSHYCKLLWKLLSKAHRCPDFNFLHIIRLLDMYPLLKKHVAQILRQIKILVSVQKRYMNIEKEHKKKYKNIYLNAQECSNINNFYTITASKKGSNKTKSVIRKRKKAKIKLVIKRCISQRELFTKSSSEGNK